jgi:ATP-dependent helicase/nuclease subunit A
MSARDPSLTAADPQRSAWVAANAGAGKTYTLANRVTRLLLAGTKPEKILCLTYTKAAAAEMQGRLFKQLGEWSMLPDAELAANIARIGAEPGGQDQLRKARRLFAQALETPGGLKILTIHAFCQNVLARFPLEAGVPASFDVLDEQTARELMAAARARVLERATSGDAERAAALGFLVQQTSEFMLSLVLDAALGTDRRKVDRFLEGLAVRGEDPAAAIRRAHDAHPGRGPDEIVTEFCVALSARRDELTGVARWMAGGGKSDRERSEELTAALAMKPGPAMWETFRPIMLGKDGEPRKEPVTKKHSASRPELRAVVDRLQDETVRAETARRAAHCAALTQAALTVVEAVREEYALAKRARAALDYDDLIVRTQVLLERGDAAAWVLFKLDGGIEHVLIDEAQDTSPEQWRIVRALTAEFFAGSGRDAERGAARTVFAVGDEKQSIFSFQGADPSQFSRNRGHFEQAALAAKCAFISEPLTQSRRSLPDILRFVDAVFAPEEARAGLTYGGDPLAHEAFRGGTGLVEVWPTVKPEADDEPDPWYAPVDAMTEESPPAKLARAVAKRIKGWIGRTTLPGHTEPVKARDIMILLPRREPLGTAIIRELKLLDVPVAGADRIALTEQIAVMDLIALGRFALLPDDDYALACVLRSPLCNVSEEELFDLAHNREGERLWQVLERRRDETAAFADAHELLNAMRVRADYIPPYEFYADVLIARGMRLRLLKRLGHEANDAIDEFLSLALGYGKDNTPSLEGFLHWIERGGAEIRRDMERGRDEVRVMTVHGAKGLEADIVILPDTTRDPALVRPQGNLLYTDDGVLYPIVKDEAPPAVQAAKDEVRRLTIEEHRRLLYVALTRARDRLHICGFENTRGVKPDSWYAMARRAAQSIGREVTRDGETILVVGDDTETVAQPAERAAATTVEIPAWARATAPLEHAAPRLIRPSDAAGLEEPAVTSPRNAKRFRRGLLVHALLARLPEVAEEDRRDIALRFLRARGADDADAIATDTIRILNDPLFAPAFGAGSRAEIGLVADLPDLGPGARVNGRIDRLAVTAGEVLIVDFKTNRPPPATEAEVSPVYRAQMALYRAAAARIFPGRRIACALVWTEAPSLMRLSDALLDGETARMAARLRDAIDFAPGRS